MVSSLSKVAVAACSAMAISSAVNASFVVTLGPGIAPAGPVVYPWTFSNPANTIGWTALGARVGPPPAFTVTGTGFNFSTFPKPYFALAHLSNAGTASAILARNESTNPEEYLFTGWSGTEVLSIENASIEIGGGTYGAYTLGIINIADMGSNPELAPLIPFLAPNASGVVSFVTWQIPGPGALPIMATGLLLRSRRRRL